MHADYRKGLLQRITQMPAENAKVLEKLLKAVRQELKRHRSQMEVEFDALADAGANTKNLNSAIVRAKNINDRANANLAKLSLELAKHSGKRKRSQ
jgi:uncharacterized membrane protein